MRLGFASRGRWSVGGGRWGPLVAGLVLSMSGCVRHAEIPPLSGPVSTSTDAVEFSLPSFPGGQPTKLSSLRGKVVLIDVWATWCEPCKAALPIYEDLQKEYAARGFAVLTVNTDAAGADGEVAAFVKNTRLTLPIVRDPNGEVIGPLLRVSMMPTSVLLDREGVVRNRHDGFDEAMLGLYQTEIEALLKEPAP